MLENQQAQLVCGLQELYKRTKSGQGWIGSPLKESSQGAPLTHDILERLGALKQDGLGTGEAFEEDLNLMQQRLIASGAGFMQRDLSSDSDSESGQSPIHDAASQKPPHFTDPFAMNRFPPTPPNQSPFPRNMQAIPHKMQTYPQPRLDQIDLSPALLQRQTWDATMGGTDESLDFMNQYESPTSFDNMIPLFGQMGTPTGTMNPAMSMRFAEDEYINPRLL